VTSCWTCVFSRSSLRCRFDGGGRTVAMLGMLCAGIFNATKLQCTPRGRLLLRVEGLAQENLAVCDCRTTSLSAGPTVNASRPNGADPHRFHITEMAEHLDIIQDCLAIGNRICYDHHKFSPAECQYLLCQRHKTDNTVFPLHRARRPPN
jgi:hypothetical protein